MGEILPLGGIRQCLVTFFLLLQMQAQCANGSWWVRGLLNILQCTGQSSQQRIIQLKMTVVLRLRNSSLDDGLME